MHKTNKGSDPKGASPAKNRGLRIAVSAAVVVGIAVLALGAIFFFNNSDRSSSAGSDGSGSRDPQAGKFPFEMGDPGPGQEAPPIELPSTEGGAFDLASARGETVLLFFQEGLMCQPCWDQLKDMEAQSGEFKDLGIDRTVSVTSDPLDGLKQKVEDENISTPVLSDPDLAVSETYGANKYGMMGEDRNGHTFIVVGPDGKIKWRADYGGAPDYTMYVPVKNLLADMREGLDGGAS